MNNSTNTNSKPVNSGVGGQTRVLPKWPQGWTLQRLQRSQSDYLAIHFPREIAGWYNFPESIRAAWVRHEKQRILSDGYVEQPDGSFLL